MHIIENIALITINETLVFQLISFLLFLFILNRIMIRPLRRVMDERSSMLERISDDITAANQNYSEIGRQIETQEAAARREAFKIRDDIETSGMHQADGILAATREEIQLIKKNAQAETESKLSAARQDIEKEAAIISDRMIAALLGRRSAP